MHLPGQAALKGTACLLLWSACTSCSLPQASSVFLRFLRSSRILFFSS